jgi:hypothetical protein
MPLSSAAAAAASSERPSEVMVGLTELQELRSRSSYYQDTACTDSEAMGWESLMPHAAQLTGQSHFVRSCKPREAETDLNE